MGINKKSMVFTTDSYKVSHWLQFPPGTEKTFYYIESRGYNGNDFSLDGEVITNKTLFFGLQAVIKKILMDVPTKEDVKAAAEFWKAHGLDCFNYDGWMNIVERGFYPLEIKAVPEGSIIDCHQVLVTIENTDPEFFWLPGWIETRLLQVWYPISVATKSWTCKKVIMDFLERTGDPAGIDFKLHSFGYRGVSSQESAEIGAMAELLNFMGTDTVAGIFAAQEYYNTKNMLGFSIPAAEHSTITSWGRDGELAAYKNMLDQFAAPGSIVAVVSDSYDIYNAVENLWGGSLKQQVIDSGATIVIRPDSGDPAKVVCSLCEILDSKFGSTRNDKGYKVLNNVRIIQGDGIDGPETIYRIYNEAMLSCFSADNIALGMGGGSLQQVNRDTYKFAMKCSAAKINGVWRDVYKAPVGAKWKKSKGGRVSSPNMRTVFLDGRLLVDEDFGTIRARAFQTL